MGRAWKFGSDVNTDEIIPGRYNMTTEAAELARHAFCEVRPEFADQAVQGDVIVAGRNFGCGSSREHAPVALKAAGVSCVIAISYARIFYRNAINIGLAILECEPAAAGIADGDALEVDPASGGIVNRTRDESYQARPLPGFVMKIVEAGGIVNFLAQNEFEALL